MQGRHPLCRVHFVHFVHLLQSQAVPGLGHFASDKAEILRPWAACQVSLGETVTWAGQAVWPRAVWKDSFWALVCQSGAR